jgi:hypothetical protein
MELRLPAATCQQLHVQYHGASCMLAYCGVGLQSLPLCLFLSYGVWFAVDMYAVPLVNSAGCKKPFLLHCTRLCPCDKGCDCMCRLRL